MRPTPARVSPHATAAIGAVAILASALGAAACRDALDAGAASTVRTGDYLGEPLPGETAVVFAPGLISTAHRQRDTAISPEGDRFVYTLWGEGRGTLVGLERQAGRWSDPEVLDFSGTDSDIEPFFDPRGGRLFFASRRPLPGETEPGDWNLWSVVRRADAWEAPEPVPGVNADGDEYFPSVTSSGTIYFTAERDGGVGGEDIFMAHRTADGYGRANALGPGVNSPAGEFNAYVAADERLIIFTSIRENGLGGGDLYLSRRDDSGQWLPARHLGPGVNSTALDYCPFLSPDGRFLFFSSFRSGSSADQRRSYRALVESLNGPQNGQGSLYWVAATALAAPDDRP